MSRGSDCTNTNLIFADYNPHSKYLLCKYASTNAYTLQKERGRGEGGGGGGRSAGMVAGGDGWVGGKG